MTYVFDIDGTICNNTYGDYQNAKPIKERIEVVNELFEQGNNIVFLTARGMGRTGDSQKEAIEMFYDLTNQQLKDWGVKFHKLFLGKPSGDYYIDDKGVKDEDFFNSKN
tara:strand:+ start:2269 stop:2595 length:327 start_codon:yes stop_codon:yes gene_type:complete